MVPDYSTPGQGAVLMPRGRVQTHARRTAGGGTTTVRQHSRKGRPRKPIVSPGHAWKLAKKAFRAGKRKHRMMAFALGGLALGELTAWGTLRGAGLMLATAGVLAMAVASVCGGMTGADW
jgi:hypothetical protein